MKRKYELEESKPKTASNQHYTLVLCQSESWETNKLSKSAVRNVKVLLQKENLKKDVNCFPKILDIIQNLMLRTGNHNWHWPITRAGNNM